MRSYYRQTAVQLSGFQTRKRGHSALRGASVDESSGIARTSRTPRGGIVDDVLNRGNGRSDVFHHDDDFATFVNLMREAHEKVPMRLTGF